MRERHLTALFCTSQPEAAFTLSSKHTLIHTMCVVHFWRSGDTTPFPIQGADAEFIMKTIPSFVMIFPQPSGQESIFSVLIVSKGSYFVAEWCLNYNLWFLWQQMISCVMIDLGARWHS